MTGGLCQIRSVFAQRLIGVLGACGIRRAPFAYVIDRTVKLLRSDLAGLHRGFRARAHHGQRHQDALNGHKTVFCFLGKVLCLSQHTGCCNIKVHSARVARHFG